MKQMLKIEILRALKSKGAVIALVLGSLISLAHVIHYQIPEYLNLTSAPNISSSVMTPAHVASVWIAGNGFNLEGFLYFLIVPILAVLPYGTSYFSDQEQGILKNIYIRVDRRNYLFSKYIAAFLSGGIVVVLPLILNVLCCMCLLPNLLPSTILPQNGICAHHAFYQIYFSNPLAYILVFIIIDFLFGGMFSCIALAASFITDYKMIVAVTPFFLQLFLHVICTLFHVWDYSSVYIMQAGYGIKDLKVLLVYLAVGIVGSYIIFFHQGGKIDVF